MATLADLENALINADRAGDTEAVNVLAAEILRLRQQSATQARPTAPAQTAAEPAAMPAPIPGVTAPVAARTAATAAQPVAMPAQLAAQPAPQSAATPEQPAPMQPREIPFVQVPPAAAPASRPEEEKPWYLSGLVDLVRNPEGAAAIGRTVVNAIAGGVRGAADIGNVLVEAFRTTELGGGALPTTFPRRVAERGAEITGGMRQAGVETEGPAFGAGRVAGQIAGTAGVGPALGTGLRAAGAEQLGRAVTTGGFGVEGAGGATRAVGIGMRAAGGGISAGAAGALTEGTPEGAGLATTIGALAPVVARPVGSFLLGLYQGIAKPFFRTQQLSEDIIASTLRDHAQQVDRAFSAGRGAPVTPGFERTLAETLEAGGLPPTGLPLLAALEERIATASPQQVLEIGNSISTRIGALQGQLARVNTQIEQQGRMLAPGVLEELNGVATGIRTQLEREQAALTALQEASTRRLPLSLLEPGEALSARVRELDTAVKESLVRPAYKAFEQAAGNTAINADALVAKAEEILKRPLSEFTPQTAPAVVSAIRDFAPKTRALPPAKPDEPLSARLARRMAGGQEQGPATATIQQLAELRKAIGASMRAAERGDAQLSNVTAAQLGELHRAIDATIDAAPNLSQQAKDLHRSATETFSKLYAPRFRTKEAERMIKPGRYTESQQLMPANVVEAYLKDEGAVKRFVATFAGDATAYDALASGIMAKFRESAVKGGVVDAAAAQRFMERNARVLKLYDDAGLGLQQKITKLSNEATAYEKAVANLRDLGAGFGKDNPPQDVLNYMLADPRRLGIALRKSTPENQDAIRRVVATRINSEISSDPAKAVDMLTDQGRLRPAYRTAFGNEMASDMLARAKMAVQVKTLRNAPEVRNVNAIPTLFAEGQFTPDQLTALQPVMDDIDRMRRLATEAARGRQVGEPMPGKVAQQEGARQGAIRPLDIQFLNTTASMIRNAFTTLERRVEDKLSARLAYMLYFNPDAGRQAIQNALRRQQRAAQPSRATPVAPAAVGTIGAEIPQTMFNVPSPEEQVVQ